MRKANLAILLVFCILLSWIGQPAFSAIPPHERAALIALYNSTNGDLWHTNRYWKTPPLAGDGFALPGTENTWVGVYCDEGNTTVLSLDLGSVRLEGSLPPEIGNLVNLNSIYLWGNLLNGSIPREIGNLINLQEIYLQENQLSGSIPPEIGNLTNLQSLYLYQNQLSGTLPPEMGNMTNIMSIDLSDNQLSGPIPPELGNLEYLLYLDLSSNMLSGTIPPELGKLTSLGYLELDSNQLRGTIPPELGNLTNISSIYLSNNQLRGPIPPELGNLEYLEYLNLSSNRLSGTIPKVLGNLKNLIELSLSGNQLRGPIPPELGNLEYLNYLRLSSNRLNGSIPSNLTNLTNLLADYADFRWNALYTNDDILRTFLNSKQIGGNWENTQTIAPANVTPTPSSLHSIDISWTPIDYTSDTGGYRVYYSTRPGRPYKYFGMTTNKTESSLTVTGLKPGRNYYFTVQTRTYPHPDNQNTVNSQYSDEVSATIPYPLILSSPNGGEAWRRGTIQNITWNSSGLSGNVNLQLWKRNKKVGTIAANIPITNGSYAWVVGKCIKGNVPVGYGYKVKICTTYGFYVDFSDGSFSIVR
jgi:Leucine-rich repeat (LRR) protein